MTESSESSERERGAAVTIPPPIIPVVMLLTGIAIDRFVAPFDSLIVVEGLWRWGLGGLLVADGLCG